MEKIEDKSELKIGRTYKRFIFSSGRYEEAVPIVIERIFNDYLEGKVCVGGTSYRATLTLDSFGIGSKGRANTNYLVPAD